MTAEKIKELLDKYDHAYYVDKEALIEDAEYDALKAKYHELTGTEEYDFVPGGSTNDKIKHAYNVSSLAKVKITEQETLKKEIERLWPVCIQWKLDGATLVFYSNQNEIMQSTDVFTVVTRGNGEYGEDKTHLLEYIQNVGTTGVINHGPIRCEAVISKKNFQALNEKLIKEDKTPFKNARNALAGMLNRKDEKPQHVEVYAYNLTITKNGAITEYNEQKVVLNILADWGWKTVPCYYPKTVEEAIEYINSFDKNSTEVEIDGLVIKHNGNKKFGETGHHPKNAIAVKFVAEEKWTRLQAIQWQVGRTGKIVPVAEFAPIELMGSTVSRATLHNKAYMDALGLQGIRKNKTEVCITKANDIIPAVIATKHSENQFSVDYHKINIPKVCPACGQDVTIVNDQLFCTNELCKEKLIGRAVHMVSRNGLDIRGLSEETIRKMYDDYNKHGQAEDATFCIGWGEEDLIAGIDGFAEKSAAKLVKETNAKCGSVPMNKFICACGIPLIGRTASKAMAGRYRTVAEIQKDIFEDNGKILLSIDGIGKEAYESLKAHYMTHMHTLLHCLQTAFDDNWECIKSEYKGEKVKIENQLIFVITGTLEKPRKYYQELIEAAGHKCAGSVSKKTNYVLVGEDAGSKETKARELGVNIITTEEELRKLL